jgi:hypothetical protein
VGSKEARRAVGVGSKERVGSKGRLGSKDRKEGIYFEN